MQPSDFFKQLEASFGQLEKKLLTVVEVETKNLVEKGFDNEGFYGDTFQAWQPRKSPKSDKKILSDTTSLQKAATTAHRQSGGIAFVFNMNYARVHNEGLQAGRGKGFTMPKRQFIGQGRILDDLIRRKFAKVINKHLDSL